MKVFSRRKSSDTPYEFIVIAFVRISARDQIYCATRLGRLLLKPPRVWEGISLACIPPHVLVLKSSMREYALTAGNWTREHSTEAISKTRRLLARLGSSECRRHDSHSVAIHRVRIQPHPSPWFHDKFMRRLNGEKIKKQERDFFVIQPSIFLKIILNK